MLLSVSKIVFQVVALGLEGVVILVFDLPVGTPGLNDFCYGFIAQWVMGLQRFFRSFEIDYDTIARIVIEVMEIPQPWVLSIDRTTWELGNSTINILMLGVVHQGVAFPLFWTFLNKRGNSNTTERSELLTEFLVVFGDVEVAYLTADREFLGALLHEEGLRREEGW